MKDLDCRCKAADEFPISISILFECFLSVMKYLKDSLG